MRLVTRDKSGASSCDTDATPPGMLQLAFSAAPPRGGTQRRPTHLQKACTSFSVVYSSSHVPDRRRTGSAVGHRASRRFAAASTWLPRQQSLAATHAVHSFARTAAACDAEARAPRLVGASAASSASLSTARRGGTTSTPGPSATSSAEAAAGVQRRAAGRSGRVRGVGVLWWSSMAARAVSRRRTPRRIGKPSVDSTGRGSRSNPRGNGRAWENARIVVHVSFVVRHTRKTRLSYALPVL